MSIGVITYHKALLNQLARDARILGHLLADLEKHGRDMLGLQLTSQREGVLIRAVIKGEGDVPSRAAVCVAPGRP